MAPSNHLLPFAHNQSRPANELALSTRYVSSGVTRKRDHPTSDIPDIAWPSSDVSTYDFGEDEQRGQQAKRFHQFTSDYDENLWEMPASSPPAVGNTQESFDPDETIDADMTINDGDEETPWGTSMGESFLPLDDKAQLTIQSAIDEGKSEVTLDSLQLTEVPSEISDLKDLVILHDNDSLVPKIKIFLSNNSISCISPRLFDVHNITVLSLRNNVLKEIPPAISKLQNLVELSVGGNQIEYLPAELLSLPKLTNLSIYPNPFRSIPHEHSESQSDNDNSQSLIASSSFMNTIPNLNDLTSPLSRPVLVDPSSIEPHRYFASIHLHESHADFAANSCAEEAGVASLVEQSLRVLVRHVILSERERRRLDLNPHFLNLLQRAISANDHGHICGVCEQPTMIGVGHVLEWWDGIKGNRGVVVKRIFCSLSCYRKWEVDMRAELESLKD